MKKKSRTARDHQTTTPPNLEPNHSSTTICLPIVFTSSSLWLSLPQLACLPRILILVSSAASTRVWLTAPAPLCTLSCLLSSLCVPHPSHFHSTDISCVCSSTSFQTTAANCLQANCSSSDQAAALQLRNQECGSMNPLPLFFPTYSIDLL